MLDFGIGLVVGVIFAIPLKAAYVALKAKYFPTATK